MRRMLPMFAVLCVLTVTVSAQQPSTPRFEVASIKPTELGPQSFLIAFRNGRYTARYVTAKRLIQSAYANVGGALPTNQILGGPQWLDADHFDVEATAPATPNSSNGTIPQAVALMLRQLLAERFLLKAHFETRERPFFAVVLARPDGMLGPGLRRRTVDCVPAQVGVAPAADGTTCMGKLGLGLLMGTGISMPILANALSQFIPDIDRTVFDRTGLTGTFDVDLRWTPDIQASTGGAATATSNSPSLFVALQEQLGLKLERTTGPVEVLVIDSVEHPTPD